MDDEAFSLALTEVLKQEIGKKYKNIKQFSDASGIAYMTISNVLKRGAGNSSIVTISKMCKALEISVEELVEKAEKIIELNSP